jgi:hypothetical protein
MLGLVNFPTLRAACTAIRIEGGNRSNFLTSTNKKLSHSGLMHGGQRVYELGKERMFFLYYVSSYASWAMSPYIGNENDVTYRSGSLLSTRWWKFDEESSKWQREKSMVSLCATEDPPEPAIGDGFVGAILPSHITRVVLDIGSFTNPFSRPAQSDESLGVIAFEPIPLSAAAIKPQTNLFIVRAAVGNRNALTTMWSQHNNASSASIFKPASPSRLFWNITEHFVPMLTLSAVLQGIDDTVAIIMLKTSMEGADFRAIKSTGESLRRVPLLITEVATLNLYTHQAARNDFCRDWLPHMSALGYTVESIQCEARAERAESWGAAWVPTMAEEMAEMRKKAAPAQTGDGVTSKDGASDRASDRLSTSGEGRSMDREFGPSDYCGGAAQISLLRSAGRAVCSIRWVLSEKTGADTDSTNTTADFRGTIPCNDNSCSALGQHASQRKFGQLRTRVAEAMKLSEEQMKGLRAEQYAAVEQLRMVGGMLQMTDAQVKELPEQQMTAVMQMRNQFGATTTTAGAGEATDRHADAPKPSRTTAPKQAAGSEIMQFAVEEARVAQTEQHRRAHEEEEEAKGGHIA